MHKTTVTRQDETHYVIYRRLCEYGLPHESAYRLARDVVAELRSIGLTVTKRSRGQGDHAAG